MHVLLHIFQRSPVGQIGVFAGLILAPGLMFDTCDLRVYPKALPGKIL